MFITAICIGWYGHFVFSDPKEWSWCFVRQLNEIYWYFPLGNCPKSHFALRYNVGNSFICDLYTQLAVSLQGLSLDQSIDLRNNSSNKAGLRKEVERHKTTGWETSWRRNMVLICRELVYRRRGQDQQMKWGRSYSAWGNTLIKTLYEQKIFKANLQASVFHFFDSFRKYLK